MHAPGWYLRRSWLALPLLLIALGCTGNPTPPPEPDMSVQVKPVKLAELATVIQQNKGKVILEDVWRTT